MDRPPLKPQNDTSDNDDDDPVEITQKRLKRLKKTSVLIENQIIADLIEREKEYIYQMFNTKER